MNTWYYFSVWLHIVGATFWIGGMLFLPIILLPSIKNHPDRSLFLKVTGLKFRYYGYIALFILFITGLFNMYFKGASFSWKFFNETHLGRLLALKFILFFSLLLINVTHDLLFGTKVLGRNQKEPNSKLRLFARWSGRFLLLISLILAYIGVLLSRGG